MAVGKHKILLIIFRLNKMKEVLKKLFHDVYLFVQTTMYHLHQKIKQISIDKDMKMSTYYSNHSIN